MPEHHNTEIGVVLRVTRVHAESEARHALLEDQRMWRRGERTGSVREGDDRWRAAATQLFEHAPESRVPLELKRSAEDGAKWTLRHEVKLLVRHSSVVIEFFGDCTW